ncbi:MAG TPA: S8 family serine peptidase [Gaiella sp.]|nr:S8 family serine peptidase [Gaiella sp.]
MSRRARLGLLGAVAALAVPGPALGARLHAGLDPGAEPRAVAAAVERATGRPVTVLEGLRALAVEARAAEVGPVPGVAWVEEDVVRRLAFTPSDPFAPRQWYTAATHAYDAWDALPPLAPVRVAVIDSGIDLTHPDLAPRIAAARSFVGGSPQDTRGHGTIVAGIIAAEPENATGIAGLAPGAELLVAKVVADNGTISVEAEARAIHWAVDRGARVINISLGGLRDPNDPSRDTYSRLEQQAIAFAVRHGAVVVAAVGNADQAPSTPWRFASYPAALPHVLGVSAMARSGASPNFSNRDAVYNDVAAPGEEIFSTFPRKLTADRLECAEQGYTPCATDAFRPPEGTSFAAPQVTAAAADLLGVRPSLRPEQVVALIERNADDATSSSGCHRCDQGRDRLTGWGELDIAGAVAALERPLPPRDGYEPNDDAGGDAYRLYFPAGSKARFVRASTDFWDDQDDVYSVRLRRGQKLFASLVPADASNVVLALWRPSTVSVTDLAHQDLRIRLSNRRGRRERLAYTAVQDGWYFLQVRLTAPTYDPVAYRLSVVRVR